MSTPLVSIALCTFNGEEFLREQLNSLVSQTYPNIEIIAVDDCSSDSTLNILKEYEKQHDFIKVYQHQENLGFRKNFEEALRKCSGNFIALCDQDDIWQKTKIEVQIKSLKDNSLVYHDSEFINESGGFLNRKMSDVMNLYQGNDCHAFIFENCISGHSCLIHKSLIPDILPFPPNSYHDKWIAFVAASKGNIVLCRESLVLYRQHSTSNTDILRNKKLKREVWKTNYLKTLGEIEAFKKVTPNDPFINNLYRLMLKRTEQFICIKLFLLVFKHRSVLFFCKKKSPLSIFGYCLKFLWGYRLKNINI